MGPLAGVRVVEFAGIGPGPFGAMVLSDFGAEVIRIVRPGVPRLLQSEQPDVAAIGSPELALDLKDRVDRRCALQILEHADVLLDPFRPGVMERNGLGPEEVSSRNPRLVYARMTGWGQDGPLAARAGHDINYIALSGALGASARAGEKPMFPLNLLGDFGGGGMLLALGVMGALLHARATGEGQVVDVAMVDGATLLTTMIHQLRQAGMWDGPPGTNLLDSGAPFYEVYATSDGRHVAVGALEPRFHARLLELLEIPAAEMPQYDRARWPEHRTRLTEVFATRTRDEWAAVFDGEDVCVSPVLQLDEAPGHDQARARGSFARLPDGRLRPAPAPRFSRTPARPRTDAPDVHERLAAWGVPNPEPEPDPDPGPGPGPATDPVG